MNKLNTHIQTKTYTLQKEDTLNSIAKKIGVEVAVIRNFHNEHSSLNNRIPFASDIPEHVSELILPAINGEKEKSHVQRVPITLEDQNSLNCDFRLLKHNYGVVLYLETKKVKKRIHYTTALQCTKEFEFVYNLTLSKSQTYIDYKIPNMLAENLANNLSKPLYPIEIQINRSGRIFGVINQPEIYKRWEAVKPKLLSYFKSPIAEQHIKAVNKAYSNVTAIEMALQRDLFFKLYFSGLYNKYFSKLEIENTVKIPLYPFMQSIQYDVKQSISPFLNANGNIIMHQKGLVSNPRSSKDIMENKDEAHHKGIPLGGELNITYEFCREKHTIKSIVGAISLLVNKKLEKKITIEAFHLK